MLGLCLYGVSLALFVTADLGLAPWDVFHQGLSKLLGLRMGLVLIAVSFVVLLLWIPIGERPGLGTVANAVLVGLWFDLAVVFLPSALDALWAKLALLALGVLLNALATALYIGAGLGPGPRDGLMTGLAKRSISIRAVRTLIEAIVLGIGWMLGGTVGFATLVYAFGIGPLVQPLLARLTIKEID